jgi:hypothetical protein
MADSELSSAHPMASQVAYREVARMGVTDVSESLVFDVTLPAVDQGSTLSAEGIPSHFKGLEKDGKDKLKPRHGAHLSRAANRP